LSESLICVTAKKPRTPSFRRACVSPKIFGVKKAVLVTQDFHITRAIYTCNQLGINVVGLGTPDWGTYQDNTVMRYTMREKLSTLKALLELHITRPKPTFLGPFEGIK
jgi:vancomycin permeability regulator SanA